MKTDTPQNGLSYGARFVAGSCLPALIAFCGVFAYASLRLYIAGCFGNPKFQHEPGEWVMIFFPVMAGAIVAVSALMINGILFAFFRPKTKRTVFLTGLLTLPVAVVGGIGLKSLL